MKQPGILTLRHWLNYCVTQYQLARRDLSAANKAKTPTGDIMRRLNHYRHQVLGTAMTLRVRLLARKVMA